MIVETARYLPLHIIDFAEYRAITRIYDKYLQAAWEDIDKILKDYRDDTMSVEECQYWEKILKIQLSAGDFLDDRVRRIKGYKMSNLPYVEQKLRDLLTVVCGDRNLFSLKVSPEKATIICDIKLASVPMRRIIENLIDRMAPATMVVTIRVVYNRWRAFSEYKWGALGAETYHGAKENSAYQKGTL